MLKKTDFGNGERNGGRKRQNYIQCTFVLLVIEMVSFKYNSYVPIHVYFIIMHFLTSASK